MVNYQKKLIEIVHKIIYLRMIITVIIFKMYYKITNKDEKHHGHKYVDGLNDLNEPFSESGLCVPGGFYFTTDEYIHNFYKFGIYVREITLPFDDPDFKMKEIPEENIWRANKIILGKRYCLNDPLTYSILGIKMMTMDDASSHGFIDILDWWLNYNIQNNVALRYSEYAIDLASKNGHDNVLDWWIDLHRNTNIELKYTKFAIDDASSSGYVDILDWWLKSGLQLKYTEYAVNNAVSNDHVSVSHWWLLGIHVPCIREQRQFCQKQRIRNKICD